MNQNYEQQTKEKTKVYLELRKSEIRLTQFLEAMPIGVFVVEGGGQPYYVNHKAQQILGKDTAPSLTAIEFPEFYQIYIAGTTQLYPKERQPLVQALIGKTSVVDDVEIRRHNKTIPIEIWGTPIFDEHDNVAYAVTTLQDITERKRAEQERSLHNKELGELNVVLTQLNEAYERFVPHELLSFLNKENVVEVNLGDQVEREMTILFSDIRGFTTLSEKMTPQDNFEFLNSYLGEMEPIIGQHYGFIDKYIGDAIMALFPTNADDAVHGSIAMLKALERFNLILQEVGFQFIRIGIGLNTGRLMLGTIGSPRRMDGTVISDAVNLASRVEGLTKTYGTALLITEQTYQKLEDPSRYKIRMIDSVTVKGKTKAVTIYEVFDADPPEIVQLKIQTLTDFEQGLQYYHQRQLNEAQKYFEKVLQLNKHDGPARTYWERCKPSN
jgi:class 3 adenylate cyclase